MFFLYYCSSDWISFQSIVLLYSLSNSYFWKRGGPLEQHQSHLMLLMGHGQGAGEVSAA